MSDNKVLFDPGFAPLVEHFSSNIEICNQILLSLNSLHQKKFKFKILCPQILNLIENNVAFYYGCLLWAFYIVNKNNTSSAEILNNPFSSISEKEIENLNYSQEIDFIISYFATFERDSKYYTGKSANIDKSWIEILNTYKEFLELNKGFVKVQSTDDIVLPKSLLNMEFDLSLYDQIMDTINNKNIKNLLNIKLFKQ